MWGPKSSATDSHSKQIEACRNLSFLCFCPLKGSLSYCYQLLWKLNAFLTEGSRAPVLFHLILHISPPNQQPSIHCSGCWAAAWLLQQMPSAGPKPGRLEKSLFKVTAACVMSPKCPVHAHWSQTSDWTNFCHHTLTAPTLPRCPCHKHQGLPGCPDISAPAFLTFLTVTIRPLMLLSVHTTSLDTRDPSWVTSQPGRLAELLEGQR